MNKLFLICAIASALTAVEDRPAPATVQLKDKVVEAQVISDTLDGVEYLMGATANAATTKGQRGPEFKLTYKAADSGEYERARVEFNVGHYDKAADFYQKAAATTTYAWVRQDSLYGAAQALGQLQKYDEALKALTEFEAKYPRSTLLPEVTFLRFSCAQAKGDKAIAQAALDSLEKNKLAWKERGIFNAAQAKSMQLRGDKKLAESGTALLDLLIAINPDTIQEEHDHYAELYGQLGIKAAQDFTAANQPAKVKEVYLRLLYAPIPSAYQCQASLALAKAETDPVIAFDYAVGAVIRGPDPATRKAALALARDLVNNKFEKDPKYAKEKDEYRSYLNMSSMH